jgi:hypothetical protein
MADRGNNVRISVSNLFKNFNQSSGFVIQVPLDLHADRWTVVCLDISELLARSHIFPGSYNLEGAHSMKGMTLCSNIQIRGVYTSDNEYDFVTLPSDLRFKFPFDAPSTQQKWLEYFDWQSIPGDWGQDQKAQLKSRLEDPLKNKQQQREEERVKMSQEID